jgi:hypothetical protein
MERIEAGLDEATRVLGRVPLRRDVAGGGEHAEHVSA